LDFISSSKNPDAESIPIRNTQQHSILEGERLVAATGVKINNYGKKG
jgi:hypothetical protein